MKASPRQIVKLIGIFADTESVRFQEILGSGLLADVRDANLDQVNRDEHRRVCGLKPLVQAFVRNMTKEGWELVEDVTKSLSGGALEFVSFLRHGEYFISGEEMKKRAKEIGANYGQHDAEWLLENQHLIPEEEQSHYIVFPGTAWRDSVGRLNVPCLARDALRWYLYFRCLEDDCRSGDRLLRPCK